MVSSSTETPPNSFEVIPEDETDPERIVEAATDFVLEMARDESVKLIEEDKDLTTMTDAQKKIVTKLMCDRIVDKYMLRFKRELYKKMKTEKATETIYVDLSCKYDEDKKKEHIYIFFR